MYLFFDMFLVGKWWGKWYGLMVNNDLYFIILFCFVDRFMGWLYEFFINFSFCNNCLDFFNYEY